MTYRRPDQVGTTARRKISDAHALRLFEKHNGVCINCSLPIDGLKQDWFVEHRRALELGGRNDDENLGPAHYECKAAKDAVDHAAAAKAKRVKKRDLGMKPAAARPIKSAPFPKSGKRDSHPIPIPPRRRDIFGGPIRSVVEG